MMLLGWMGFFFWFLPYQACAPGCSHFGGLQEVASSHFLLEIIFSFSTLMSPF